MGNAVASQIIISFAWRKHPGGHLADSLRELGIRALTRLGVESAEVGVLICDDATIRSLNRRFRNKNYATDVLAFPAGYHQVDGLPYLGDVAISLDTARRQAEERGQDLSLELMTLLLHALIHLCGWDHETDEGEMAALEVQLYRELLA